MIKKFFLYILRSYLWSAFAIIMVTLFETTIANYCSNSVDNETPFASPVIAALICGILYSIYNLAVIITLYKYSFSPIEVIVESICLVNVITYIDDIIRFLVPKNQLWNYKIIHGIDVYERVWWYNSDTNIIYGICIIILLCLLYIKVIKPAVEKYSKY